jgi:hypothetical protein
MRDLPPQALTKTAEPLSNRAQLEMVLDRSCEIFRRCVAELKQTPHKSLAVTFDRCDAPAECTRAAIEIAATMVDFSMIASTAIVYSPQNKNGLPTIKLSASSDAPTSPPLSTEWILDKTRKFTLNLLNQLDRAPFAESVKLEIPHPDNQAQQDVTVLAARVAAQIVQSDFAADALSAKTDETAWLKGGRLTITVDRLNSLVHA